MSAEEASFLKALQRVVGPGSTVEAKVLAANLFGSDASPEETTSNPSHCDTVIDFVIYNPSKSRVLGAIAIDENSSSHPERMKRDSLLTELFDSKQVTLLRVPISWAYNPQGIHAQLQKAGIISD